LGAITFAAGIGPNRAATLSPTIRVTCAQATVVRRCSGGSAKTCLWSRRPFFDVDRRSPLSDFERIVDHYPVFRVA
jgi:hypothetical protein